MDGEVYYTNAGQIPRVGQETMGSYDISFPIRDGMPGFPGDPKVVVHRVHDLDQGGPYNLSSLTLSSHTGTHIDPPIHFIPGGLTIDQIDLARFNGPCRVVDVARRAARSAPRTWTGRPTGTERVLFRTSNSERWARSPDEFFSDYTALSPRLGGPAAAAGGPPGGPRFPVDRVGPDRSVPGAPPTSRGRDVSSWRGCGCSRRCPEGEYELRCLPLRIQGGDGGPCRAAARSPGRSEPMPLPPWPGPGHYALTLGGNSSFYLLLAIIVVFASMFTFLCWRYPGRKRGLEGFREAAGISLAFLFFSVLLVMVLAMKDPMGNRSALALDEVVLPGVLAHVRGARRHRRQLGPHADPGRDPVAGPRRSCSPWAMFGGLFLFYFYAGG